MSKSERAAALEVFESEHGVRTAERWAIKNPLHELGTEARPGADDEPSSSAGDA